ncbi:uncharacterized protein DDB_G0290587 [Patella vulgata]|uniref:uncharacterized protein DDB_G0290587 n=1 Tax=Patella vulgata TaxID=6465 RepID=UPI00217FB3BC|nr:uncharacterized protein DDB_G0290587 [Patella vulgata]
MSIRFTWLLLIFGLTNYIVFSAPVTCDLELSVESAELSPGSNISVLCDATCSGVGSTGIFGWYDNTNTLVENSGRIFSMKYNRGRYSRLFIRNFMPEDSGTYVCFKITEDGRKQESFYLYNEGDTFVNGELEEDKGPTRGDIGVYDPFVPEIRVERSVRLKRQAGVTTDVQSGDLPSTTDDSTPDFITDANYSLSQSTLTVPSEFMSHTSSTSEPNSPKPEPENTPSIPRPEPETTPKTKLETPPTFRPEKKQNSPKPKPGNTPQPKPETTLKAEPESKSEPPQVPKDPDSEPKPEPKSEPPQPETDPNPIQPQSDFGRIGLVAFVLALAVAFLLLYSLLMVICIPRCLRKRKSKSLNISKSPKTNEKEKNVPESITLTKIEDNGLPSPGPSDAGFTTIDLDEQQTEKNNTVDGSNTEAKIENKVEAQIEKQITNGEGQSSEDNNKEQERIEESLLDSVLFSSAPTNEDKPETGPKDEDIEFIDKSQVTDITPPPISTPDVVDEPTDTSTKTTEVRLDIVEADDGHKQIKLSTSSPSPDDLPPPSPESPPGEAFDIDSFSCPTVDV